MKHLKSPFPRNPEISGTAYYNCEKKGHIARGYYQSTRKFKTVEKKVIKGLEKPFRKAAVVQLITTEFRKLSKFTRTSQDKSKYLYFNILKN